jgi:hypothetical protein
LKAKKSDKSQARGAIWRFVLVFVATFIVAYLLWHFTAPLANELFTFVGGNIVMLLDGADYTKGIGSTGRYIVIDYEPAKEGKPLTLEYKGFTFNTVFLVALIMAVPNVNYKLRLKILIAGLAILFPVQIFKFVVYVFNYYCQNMRRKSGAFIYPAFMHHSIGYADRIMWRIDGQIIPVIIWGGLFYYYRWHKLFTSMRKKDEPATEAK